VTAAGMSRSASPSRSRRPRVCPHRGCERHDPTHDVARTHSDAGRCPRPGRSRGRGARAGRGGERLATSKEPSRRTRRDRRRQARVGRATPRLLSEEAPPGQQRLRRHRRTSRGRGRSPTHPATSRCSTGLTIEQPPADSAFVVVTVALSVVSSAPGSELSHKLVGRAPPT